VQSREEIWETLHRSVDRATAVILANIDTPKKLKRGSHKPGAAREHDPYASLAP
jgi:hypothetical protein